LVGPFFFWRNGMTDLPKGCAAVGLPLLTISSTAPSHRQTILSLFHRESSYLRQPHKESGVSTTRPTSSAGLFEINPIIPGTYTVTASVKGFQTFRQENLVVDALKVTG
jgi:hypothetical protein